MFFLSLSKMYVNRHCVSPSKLCFSCSRDSEIFKSKTTLPQMHVSNTLPQSLETAISKKHDVSNTTIPSIVSENQYPTSKDHFDLSPAPLSESVVEALRSRPQKQSLVRLVSFHSSNDDDENKKENFVDALLNLGFMSEQETKMDCSEYCLEPRPLKEASLPRDRADADVKKRIKCNGIVLTNDDTKSTARWSSKNETPFTLQRNNDSRTEHHHFDHDGATNDALAEFDQVILPSFQKKSHYGLECMKIEVSAAMENLHTKHKERVVPLYRAVKKSQKSQKKVWEIEKNLRFIKRRHFEIMRESVCSRKKMMDFAREIKRTPFNKKFPRRPEQRNLRAQAA